MPIDQVEQNKNLAGLAILAGVLAKGLENCSFNQTTIVERFGVEEAEAGAALEALVRFKRLFQARNSESSESELDISSMRDWFNVLKELFPEDSL